MLAGGAHGLTTDQARRLRAAVADDRPGRGAGARCSPRCARTGFAVEGERLKRLPREFAPEHPRADLLTLKTLFAVQEHEPQEWLHTPEVARRVAAAWRALARSTPGCAEHVGPARDVRQR